MRFLLPLLSILLITSTSTVAEDPATSNKSSAVNILPSAGVVLTFDDRNMNQWVKQIPLFEKYDAKVTFFVDHFHTLKPQQIAALKKLKARGGTVGLPPTVKTIPNPPG